MAKIVDFIGQLFLGAITTLLFIWVGNFILNLIGS